MLSPRNRLRAIIAILIGIVLAGLLLQVLRDPELSRDTASRNTASGGKDDRREGEDAIPARADDDALPPAAPGNADRIPAWTAVPVSATPGIDRRAVLARAARLDKKTRGGVFRFAEPIEVDISPQTHGRWDRLPDGTEVWRMRIFSEGAQSLNFGFSEFAMPGGGRLSIFPKGREQDRPYRDFTAEDNEDHGQLWTPLYGGDEAFLELTVPPGGRDELRLALSRVNHGFRGFKRGDAKIGGDSSGSCNIDVACTGDPTVGTLVQMYADQIRSVGAFTLSGFDACSGALINNTANDNTPYFLTAEHCEIDSGNAPSMVVYFNFENSTCRTPGSAASGQAGDGDISQFVSGAILRAKNAASDFCLVELDDPVPPAYNAFFAGWDRTGANGPATGIHHPAVAEKRISFELDDTVDDGATHVRVTDWDHGTTEQGSSGSPLFDSNGRIIGDLTGGGAACGNDEYDTYGRLSVSWTGGGTPETRLSDWLDPEGTGVTALDGINQDDVLTIDDVQLTEGDSGTANLDFTVTLIRESNETITVDYATFDGTAEAGTDYVATSGTLNFGPAETTKTVSVTVNGDTTPEEHETFEVRLTNPGNAFLVKSSGLGTIRNDDFIPPVITSNLSANGGTGLPFSYQITANHTPTSYAISAEPAGMTIDDQTGEISWTPSTPGQATVTISASNPAGSDSETLTIEVIEASLPVALDTDLTFTGSTIPWQYQTAVTHDGIDAAAGGDISDSQMSWFETSITAPPEGETVSFWWKVSSEEGWDLLRFLVDGVAVETISGERDWAEIIHSIPGGATQVLRWEYSKDDSVSRGNDTGYVDQIVLASENPLPIITSPGSLRLEEDVDNASFMVTASGADSIAVTGLPPGLVFTPGPDVISGTATTSGITVATVTATNGNGSTERSLEIEVFPELPVALDAGAGGITWITTGDAEWEGTVAIHHDGEDSARSGEINDSQSSTLEAAVNFDGAQLLSFWWRVSSEESWDHLRFFRDGTEVDQISGTVGNWVQKTGLAISPGPGTLRWVYQKDGSQTVGEDRGWLDEVTFTYQVPEVTGLTAGDGADHDGVVIGWNALGDASTYRVFRSETDDLSAAAEIASVPAGTLTYRDTTAVPGTTYFYWVRGHHDVHLFGAPGSSDSGFVTPDGPVSVTGISPEEGLPGTVVTIDGSDLDRTREVTYAGESVPFSANGPGQISVTVPGDASPGTAPFILSSNSHSTPSPDFTVEPNFTVWLRDAATAAGVPFIDAPLEELIHRDDDLDGISNGDEFGLGGDPYQTDNHLVRTRIVVDSGEIKLQFFRARGQLTYRVQTTAGLHEPIWVDRFENPGTVGEMVEVTLDPSWGIDGRLFGKVLVEGIE